MIQAKANELVSLGDMSALRPEIGTPHAFSQFELEEMDREEFVRTTENMCTFYGRDRGEENVGWKVAHTFEEFFEQVENGGGEWYYVMQDGAWYCGNTYSSDARFYKKLVLLAEALETVEEESKTWKRLTFNSQTAIYIHILRHKGACMPGFVDVSNMTSEEVKRMGHD
jgi:hypothetical protein